MPKIIVRHIAPKSIFALVNHTLVGGKSGSGKSNVCEWICCKMMEKGWKFIDVFDKDRHENMLYGLEEDNPKLIEKMYLYKQEPKSYKNEVIMLCGTLLKYNKKLPANIKLMAFDQNDLTIDDMYNLLGGSETLQGILASISNEFGDDINMVDLYDILVNKQFRGEPALIQIAVATKSMVVRNIRRWLNSGMFSDKLPKIDFVKILNDKETITSFSTYLLDSEADEQIAYGLILKKINDIKKMRKAEGRVVVYIRELSIFFQEGWGLSRKHILEFLRFGRDRGIDLVTCMQRVLDIKSAYRRQFGIVIQLRSDKVDAEKLLEFQGDINPLYLMKVPRFGVGEAILVTGTTWEYPILYPPTSHRHKKPRMDVFKILIKKYGAKKYTDDEVRNIVKYDLVKKEVEVKDNGKTDYSAEGAS